MKKKLLYRLGWAEYLEQLEAEAKQKCPRCHRAYAIGCCGAVWVEIPSVGMIHTDCCTLDDLKLLYPNGVPRFNQEATP